MPGDLKASVPPLAYLPLKWEGAGAGRQRSDSDFGQRWLSDSPAIAQVPRAVQGEVAGMLPQQPLATQPVPIAASCSATSAHHYLYSSSAPAQLPLRAPPPKVVTSALWKDEWGYSGEAAQPGLVAAGMLRLAGVAVECIAVPRYGARRQDGFTDPAQEMEWVNGGLAEDEFNSEL